MYSIISEVNQVERCRHLAEVFETALAKAYPGAKVTHARLGGEGNLRRFEVMIRDVPPFALEFDWMDSQTTGQNDAGWAAVFMEKVEAYLRSH